MAMKCGEPMLDANLNELSYTMRFSSISALF
jgi:hypothetical protein